VNVGALRGRRGIAAGVAAAVVVGAVVAWRLVADGSDGSGPSREEIRDHLDELPGADPAEVGAYLAGENGAPLQEATTVGRRMVAAGPTAACPELEALEQMPEPQPLATATAAVPDPVLREGYGALLGVLGRAQTSCAADDRLDATTAEDLRLVMTGIEGRLDQLGVDL